MATGVVGIPGSEPDPLGTGVIPLPPDGPGDSGGLPEGGGTAPINFPDAPAQGELFTAMGKTWMRVGEMWVVHCPEGSGGGGGGGIAGHVITVVGDPTQPQTTPLAPSGPGELVNLNGTAATVPLINGHRYEITAQCLMQGSRVGDYLGLRFDIDGVPIASSLGLVAITADGGLLNTITTTFEWTGTTGDHEAKLAYGVYYGAGTASGRHDIMPPRYTIIDVTPGSGTGGGSSSGSGTVVSQDVGVISMWGDAPIPATHLLCDGSPVPAGAEYDALRAMYPNGLPDLRDRFVVGASATRKIGDSGGEATHTLTIEEMPSHSHANYVGWNTGEDALPVWDGQSTKAVYGLQTTGGPTGGGQPHNNLPPFYALCFIIAAKVGVTVTDPPAPQVIVAQPNAVINGGFAVWQRSNTWIDVPPNAWTYTADQWQAIHNGVPGSNVTVERLSPTSGRAGGGRNGARWRSSVFQPGATYSSLLHRIEGVDTFAGRTVTLSFEIASSYNFTGDMKVHVRQVVGPGDEPIALVQQTFRVTDGEAPRRVEYTFEMPSIDGKTLGDGHHIIIQFDAPVDQSFAVDLGAVKLEPGSVATPYIEPPYADELARCQRYFIPVSALGVASNGGRAVFQGCLPVMRKTPIITGTGPLGNAEQGGVIEQNPSNFTVFGQTVWVGGFDASRAGLWVSCSFNASAEL
jgi:microcystin-dependent protein